MTSFEKIQIETPASENRASFLRGPVFYDCSTQTSTYVLRVHLAGFLLEIGYATARRAVANIRHYTQRGEAPYRIIRLCRIMSVVRPKGEKIWEVIIREH